MLFVGCLIVLGVLFCPGLAGAMMKKEVPPEARVVEVQQDFVKNLKASVAGAVYRYESWKAQAAAGGPGKKPLTRSAGVHTALLAPASQRSVKGAEVRLDKRTGVPVFLKAPSLLTKPEAEERLAAQGRKPRVVEPEHVALACLDKYRQAFRVKDPFSEFRVKHELRDKLGKTHVKFQQVYSGVPLWGKELIVHLDAKGSVYLVTGRTEPTPELDTSPVLTADRALQVVIGDAAPREVKANQPPELVIHIDESGQLRLAYHVEAKVGWERWQYFVDAKSGAVLEKYNDTWYEQVQASGIDLFGQTRDFSAWRQGGTYYMIDTSLSMHSADPSLPGNLGAGNLVVLDAKNQDPEALVEGYIITSGNPRSGWDKAAVTALYNLRTTCDYYRRTFGRNSIDGRGMNVVGLVHVGSSWENACWDGSANIVCFGDGGKIFDSLVKALDVAAHELAHGITQYTANLEYKYQSGALNEAFSDIFGCMVDRDDWVIGEDVTKAAPGFLRSLSNPHQGLECLPAHMSEYKNLPLSEDNGGVHTNCGIPSRAAYLLAEGLSREGLGSSIGREKTEKIFYRALTNYLTRQSDFLDCRRAAAQAAEDLFGAESPEVKAVEAAWDAVGVTEAGGGGGTGGSGEVPPAAGGDNLLFIFYDYDWWGNPIPYLGMRLLDGREYYVSDQPVSVTRPAVVAGGELVLFVDWNNNLWEASLNPNDDYQEQVTTGGLVRTIAGSLNDRYFAFTTTGYDNILHVLDLDAPEDQDWTRYELKVPTDVPGVFQPLEYADVIDFDLTGRHVVFDAVRSLKLEGGGTYRFWSVYRLNLRNGNVECLVPVQPQGVQVFNPVASQTRDWLLAVDVLDTRQQKYQCAAVNLQNGKWGLVAEVVNPTGSCGWPSFGGDDSYVVIEYQNDLVKVPLAEKDGAFSGKFASRQVVTRLAYCPRVYRVGVREIKPRIQVAPTAVDFGRVTVGQTGSAILRISNTGNYDLTIDSFEMTDAQNFGHTGVHTLIAPGAQVEIAVRFTPVQAGVKTATLAINSDDPVSPRLEVALRGEGVSAGDTTPPSVAGTDPANNATGVPVDKAITVTFSEDVQPGPAYGSIALKDAAGRVVAVTKSLDGKVLSIKPSSNLAYSTTYTVFIPAGAVQDLAGNPFAQNYSFSFTTAAARKKGDVNGDGVVNVLDVVKTVNIALGRVQPTDEERQAADANSDGVINVLDVVQIVNIALGRT